ncbi:MAG: SDR family NAD(P)-dependent oxidoreductase [Deltaproteobacteria bacterium]|nr:SDR family NAD(P)-dependent oxidoreductase [Deltaproteobacteria bacterium]
MKKNDLQNKKILITGAAGFIGSHLTERLVQLGASVKAFVHYNSFSDVGHLKETFSSRHNQLEIVYGDIRELDSVRHAVKGSDLVFHLASIISVPYSTMHPQEVFTTNVTGTLNVLLACQDSSVQKLLQTSSSEVYGSALYTPIDEKHPRQSQSVYAASKVSADALCYSFYRSYNLPVAICRPFNTYGPRQSGRAVIPTIISQALRKKEINLGTLTTRRDFTYVTDTVEGLIEVCLSNKTVGHEVNLGVGYDISIEELVNLISDLLGTKLKIKTEKKRLRPPTSEVSQLLSNNALVKNFTDWLPKVSFKHGLQNTIAWIEKNISSYDLHEYRL